MQENRRPTKAERKQAAKEALMSLSALLLYLGVGISFLLLGMMYGFRVLETLGLSPSSSGPNFLGVFLMFVMMLAPMGVGMFLGAIAWLILWRPFIDYQEMRTLTITTNFGIGMNILLPLVDFVYQHRDPKRLN